MRTLMIFISLYMSFTCFAWDRDIVQELNHLSSFTYFVELSSLISQQNSIETKESPFWTEIRSFTEMHLTNNIFKNYKNYKVLKLNLSRDEYVPARFYQPIISNHKSNELFIVFTGLFSDAKSLSVAPVTLSNFGYHVLIVASAYPGMMHILDCNKIGTPDKDGILFYQAVKSFLKTYGNQFSKIHVSGVSYGGVIGQNVMKYLHRDLPEKTGSLFLLSTPQDIPLALRSMREQILECHQKPIAQRRIDHGCMIANMWENKLVETGLAMTANPRCNFFLDKANPYASLHVLDFLAPKHADAENYRFGHDYPLSYYEIRSTNDYLDFWYRSLRDIQNPSVKFLYVKDGSHTGYTRYPEIWRAIALQVERQHGY